MGDQLVETDLGGAPRRAFIRRVLNDLHALEQILDAGLIERKTRRIGAEQEVFLVDRDWRPAMVALELLEKIEDPRFTTELGKFNLEMNLDPLTFGGSCLSRLETQLNQMLGRLREVASELGIEVVLTGILPTLRKSDLGLENMTPKPRYFALNRAMSNLRGGAYELYIKGLDELLLKHDSVMLEACNASFQVHFQVGAEEFANLYNIAQVAAAPVLAAAVNSPMLFGRELWRETRIALFQQSVDTRSSMNYLRERSPRVTFGRDWVRSSVLELFQEDISRFKALVTGDFDEDPLALLEEGKIPQLKSLCMHNSTVYRWNRACYGVRDGKPHLRIENRVLPCGPSVLDEVANAAFWFGLLAGLSAKYEDITQLIHFEDARMNFGSAARMGLGAHYSWLNGRTHSAVNLICDHLLPLAYEGLERRGVDSSDAERYLSVIDKRVSSGRTGSQWQAISLGGMRGQGNLSERLNALTAAMVERQKGEDPVSEWAPARLIESSGWKKNFLRVEQYMTTDLFTVTEDESLDLVASLMEWKRIRHIPVEDADHRLVGLISYRALLKLMSRGLLNKPGTQHAVSDVMNRTPVTVSPGSSTLEAIELMRQHEVSCLPVVAEEHLVGIITERDLMNVAATLLEQQLKA